MQRVRSSRRSVGVLAAILMCDEKTRAECWQVKRSTKHGEAEATPNAAPAANPAQ